MGRRSTVGSTNASTFDDSRVELLESIQTSSTFADQTRPRFVATADRLFAFCGRGWGLGSLDEVTPEIARAFVVAPLEDREPSVATMHLRRAVVRFVFRQARELGLASHDPCVDLRLPPRSGLAARPLTDDEIAVCRSYSLTSLTNTRTPAAWALAEATARSAEIPHIRVCDIDLDKRRVWLHGSPRTVERWAPLTTWGRAQLERRVATLEGTHAPLVYAAKGSPESGQASSCIAVTDTLVRAGLGDEPDIRPVSVAAWAGRSLLDQTGRIDAAARLLGVRSLDRATRIVAWDWTQADNQDG
jgi:integrase/recombinase XerC